MTPTTPTSNNKGQSYRTRLPIILIANLCVAVILLFAVPVIYKGQQEFLPHATVNREYVDTAIGSGESDFIHNALRTTEVARAMARDDHVSTMGVMQLAVAFLAVLFFGNSLYLFRLHRRSKPATALNPAG